MLKTLYDTRQIEVLYGELRREKRGRSEEAFYMHDLLFIVLFVRLCRMI